MTFTGVIIQSRNKCDRSANCVFIQLLYIPFIFRWFTYLTLSWPKMSINVFNQISCYSVDLIVLLANQLKTVDLLWTYLWNVRNCSHKYYNILNTKKIAMKVLSWQCYKWCKLCIQLKCFPVSTTHWNTQNSAFFSLNCAFRTHNSEVYIQYIVYIKLYSYSIVR